MKRKKSAKRITVSLDEFRDMIVKAEEGVNILESMFPDFIRELRLAYPWYMRWKTEYIMWQRGSVIQDARREMAHYTAEVVRLESEGATEADIDERTVQDLKMWLPDGIVQEVAYHLRSMTSSGPYR